MNNEINLLRDKLLFLLLITAVFNTVITKITTKIFKNLYTKQVSLNNILTLFILSRLYLNNNSFNIIGMH